MFHDHFATINKISRSVKIYQITLGNNSACQEEFRGTSNHICLRFRKKQFFLVKTEKIIMLLYIFTSMFYSSPLKTPIVFHYKVPGPAPRNHCMYSYCTTARPPTAAYGTVKIRVPPPPAPPPPQGWYWPRLYDTPPVSVGRVPRSSANCKSVNLRT